MHRPCFSAYPCNTCVVGRSGRPPADPSASDFRRRWRHRITAAHHDGTWRCLFRLLPASVGVPVRGSIIVLLPPFGVPRATIPSRRVIAPGDPVFDTSRAGAGAPPDGLEYRSRRKPAPLRCATHHRGNRPRLRRPPGVSQRSYLGSPTCRLLAGLPAPTDTIKYNSSGRYACCLSGDSLEPTGDSKIFTSRVPGAFVSCDAKLCRPYSRVGMRLLRPEERVRLCRMTCL